MRRFSFSRSRKEPKSAGGRGGSARQVRIASPPGPRKSRPRGPAMDPSALKAGRRSLRERAGIENRVKSLSATRFWRCAPRRPADEKTAPHVPPLSAASTAPPPTAAVPARFLSSHGERSDAAHRDSPHALPRGLRRAKRRRETPQPAQNTHHDAFQSFHAVPAGTAPRAARPPRSNRQRRPHRSAAANRRAQNALYRAPSRPFGTGRKIASSSSFTRGPFTVRNKVATISISQEGHLRW